MWVCVRVWDGVIQYGNNCISSTNNALTDDLHGEWVFLPRETIITA